ncbi:L-ascorbate oxidase [Vigna unguiculata]|uniref:L-ascorbate oxidase n=1 Tax=Vigna unguiculata TaxID=3917 RepID=A0A4D6NJ50_VIGUN|nr:L-ascorbate oxidase [Vigna unguiculata]
MEMRGIILGVLMSLVVMVRGEDPYIYHTWNVTYGIISPLGVPQQGILINGKFPGPRVASNRERIRGKMGYPEQTAPFLQGQTSRIVCR